MKKLLFIGLMIGASSVAGANTPLAIQPGNPAPKDKAVITTTPYYAQENLISQYSLAFGFWLCRFKNRVGQFFGYRIIRWVVY